MYSLDVSKLKRNPEILKSKVKVRDNDTIANDRLYIIFPERFCDTKLVVLDTNTQVICYYALVDDSGNYSVVMSPIYHDTMPSEIEKISVGGEINYRLTYEKGDVIIKYNKLPMSNLVLYPVFNEFIDNGKVPWFFDYVDVSRIYVNASKHAGSDVADNPLIFEVLASLMSKSDKDKFKFFRQVVTDKTLTERPYYPGLSNVFYSLTNTASKTIGSYFGDGLKSAILEPETKTSGVGEILRQ